MNHVKAPLRTINGVTPLPKIMGDRNLSFLLRLS